MWRIINLMNTLIVLLLSLAAVQALRVGLDSVAIVGRYDFDSDGNLISQWSGSGIKFSLIAQSTQILVNLDTRNCVDRCKYFLGVNVNCNMLTTVEVSDNSSSPSFKMFTTIGERYDFHIFKKTEPSCVDAQGIMTLGGFSVEGGLLENSKSPFACFQHSRKMLVIGDSISAAYGVEGVYPCVYSAATQNVADAYSYLLSQWIGADLHTVAWSGKGVVRNYNDPQVGINTIPVIYNRTIATDPSSYWNPQKYRPDIILVTLGTNDYSTDPIPTDEQFISTLSTFLLQVQSDYSDAVILSTCAPMKAHDQCKNIAAAAKIANVNFADIPQSTMDGGYSCSYHPNVLSHQNIASYLLPIVNSLLKK